MTQEEKTKAMEEMIATTYENMGFAVLDVNPFAPGVFKLDIIDTNGPKEVYVTVLLHMSIPGQNANKC
jgi:hypothetical protein